MKQYIIKVLIMTLILSAISVGVILLLGNTYTTSFLIRDNKYDVKISSDRGEIEVIEEKLEDNEYFIKMKSKKPGVVFINIVYDNNTYDSKFFYVHKSMIITENDIFGYSRGSEIIPISMTIILIYILFFLIKKYRMHIKENLYQYKNVAYLGIIIFITSFTILTIFSIFNYNGLSETVNNTIRLSSIFSIVLFPISLITFILVTISNIRLVFKEGKSFRNMLGVFLGIFLCLLPLIPDFAYDKLRYIPFIDIYNLNGPGPYIYNFLETLVYSTVTYLECVLIATIIIALKSVKKKVDYDKDYIIILGCQIKKDGSLTPLLKKRVDRALDFRNAQIKDNGKDIIFVPSGGKGSDEVISEAEAMKKYLLENGIKENNIILEDKSKNTEENISFSSKLINDKNAKVAFSTTNYHVFRAGLIANQQGLYYEGIGSKTKAYFWINAFIREFIGTLYSEKKKHICIFILLMMITSLMIAITFYTNNT